MGEGSATPSRRLRRVRRSIVPRRLWRLNRPIRFQSRKSRGRRSGLRFPHLEFPRRSETQDPQCGRELRHVEHHPEAEEPLREERASQAQLFRRLECRTQSSLCVHSRSARGSPVLRAHSRPVPRAQAVHAPRAWPDRQMPPKPASMPPPARVPHEAGAVRHCLLCRAVPAVNRRPDQRVKRNIHRPCGLRPSAYAQNPHRL